MQEFACKNLNLRCYNGITKDHKNTLSKPILGHNQQAILYPAIIDR